MWVECHRPGALGGREALGVALYRTILSCIPFPVFRDVYNFGLTTASESLDRPINSAVILGHQRKGDAHAFACNLLHRNRLGSAL